VRHQGRCIANVVGFVPETRTGGEKTVSDAWIEAPISEPGDPRPLWVCAIRFVKGRHGEPVIGELRIFPNEPYPPNDHTPGRWSAEEKGYRATVPNGGITARLLRAFRIGDRAKFVTTMQQNARRERDRERREQGSVTSPYLKDPITRWLAASARGRKAPAPPRHRRKDLSDFDCARLAREYADLIAEGNRQPIATLAGSHRLTKTTIRMRIHLARKRGFLSRAGQGYGGGTLTPAARRLLA